MRSPDNQTLAKGAGLLLPATLLGNALLLGVDAWLNGFLSLEDYGLFGAVKRVIQLLGFVGLLGMENALIRAVARSPTAAAARVAVKTAMTSAFLASVVLAGVLIAAAPGIASVVDSSASTALVLRIAAISIPLASLRLLAVAAAQGRGAMAPRAIVMFLAWPVLQVAGIGFFAGFSGPTAVAAASGYALAVGVGAGQAAWHLISVMRSTQSVTGSGHSGEGGLLPMLAVAWPLWAQGVAMALYTWADQVLLAGLRDPAAAGVYGPVATLAPLFGVGLGALNGAFAPMIAKKHAEGDREGLQDLYRVVTRWAVILALPPVAIALGSPMSLLAPWPAATVEAGAALRVAAVGQLICTLVGSVNYLLIMCGRQRDTLYNAVPAVLLSLGGSILLIPKYGVLGAAIANALAMGLANVLGLLQVIRHLRIHPFAWSLIRPFVAAAVPLFSVVVGERVWGGGWTTLCVAGGLGTAGFLAAYALLGIDPGDRMVLDAVRRKIGR